MLLLFFFNFCSAFNESMTKYNRVWVFISSCFADDLTKRKRKWKTMNKNWLKLWAILWLLRISFVVWQMNDFQPTLFYMIIMLWMWNQSRKLGGKFLFLIECNIMFLFFFRLKFKRNQFSWLSVKPTYSITGEKKTTRNSFSYFILFFRSSNEIIVFGFMIDLSLNNFLFDLRVCVGEIVNDIYIHNILWRWSIQKYIYIIFVSFLSYSLFFFFFFR